MLNFILGSHCVSPPTPPSGSNLILLNYNQWNPPAHGDVIEYVCNAGGHNRFESNFSKSSLEVECLPENQFASVTWPTCVSGELRLSKSAICKVKLMQSICLLQTYNVQIQMVM